MKKYIVFFWFALLFMPVIGRAAEPVRIVAGTSLISDIVADLTQGKSQILTLIQGSSCPGHENANTGDYVFAAKANLLLIHPFQRNLQQVQAMLAAVDNKALKIVEISPRGSWLIPAVQKQAVTEIAEVLEAAAPDMALSIQQRARLRLAKIDALAAECHTRLATLHKKRVIAANMQAEFVRWAGLEVVQTFGRSEDINARVLAEILDAVKKSSVSGVIDNYQSGPDAGLPLALELGVAHVVLSNFPGSSDDATDYFSLMLRNIKQLQRLETP